jgi:predicted DsbA family dithiol-disulfide isomerase
MTTPTLAERRTLTIDLWADIACPWCWIGEHRLLAAVERLRAARPEVHVALAWRPYQLQPQLPRGGVPWETFAREKFGSAERMATMFGHVAQAGAADGLDFRFDRITVAPNTTDAHRLVLWTQARTPDGALATADALFRAHFAEGRDVTDRGVLAEIAAALGHDAAEARAMLDADAHEAEVRAAGREAGQLGIRGVPFFVLDQRLAVSGAQPAELFDRALAAALEGESSGS